jgi:hypothetical protein
MNGETQQKKKRHAREARGMRYLVSAYKCLHSVILFIGVKAQKIIRNVKLRQQT